ncbi:MAG: hypothetical protein HYX53_10335 [Chloroflexi bacterium]|nr:hypothetical protein [Chloroflexota bacterium]
MTIGSSKKFRALRLSIIVIAGSALTVAVALAAPPDKPAQPPVDQPFDSGPYDAAVAADRLRRSKPQDAFLADFNSGKRQITELQEVEVGADYLVQPTYEIAATRADRVVVMRTEMVEFAGSGADDLPAARITYRVVQNLKGDKGPGEEIILRILGGPYRQATGEEVLVHLPLFRIDSPGDLVLAALRESPEDGGTILADVSTKYRLSSEGAPIDDENGRIGGIVGKSIPELAAMAASR